MSKMTAATRSSLPKSEFALPASRKYPINDAAHAVNAKARATQMVSKGKLSPAMASRIRSKANQVLGK